MWVEGEQSKIWSSAFKTGEKIKHSGSAKMIRSKTHQTKSPPQKDTLSVFIG